MNILKIQGSIFIRSEKILNFEINLELEEIPLMWLIYSSEIDSKGQETGRIWNNKRDSVLWTFFFADHFKLFGKSFFSIQTGPEWIFIWDILLVHFLTFH